MEPLTFLRGRRRPRRAARRRVRRDILVETLEERLAPDSSLPSLLAQPPGSNLVPGQFRFVDQWSEILAAGAPLRAISPAAARVANQLLIVDAAVQGFSAQAAADGGLETHVLEPGRDGLAQVSELLASRTGVTAVHVISHGSAGRLELAGNAIDLGVLETRQGEIARWRHSLTEDADVLLYGCDVGRGTAGEAFVNRLAELTGADVAASIDATGAAALGGNWALETSTGPLNQTLPLHSVAPQAVSKVALLASVQFTSSSDFDSGSYQDTNHTTANQLQLSTIQATHPIMAVANAGEDTVSILDTSTGHELARYRTWFGPGSPGYAPHPDYPWWGAAPSRIAIDADGNIYVANRHMEDGKPADVIKILGSGGIDRNGNGVIDTSSDVNHNGVIDPSEILPLGDSNGNGQIDTSEIQDERIAWISRVGAVNGYGRSLALDADGNVWLGLYNTREYYKLDPSDGHVLTGPINVSPNTPYGAIVDANGILWGASLDGNLLRIDTRIPSVTVYGHGWGTDYGIAVGNGKVYQANISGNTYTEFNPVTGSFSSPAAMRFSAFGIAVDSAGNIVCGNADSLGVVKFRPDGSVLWSSGPQPGTGHPRGVQVDVDDNIWLTHPAEDKVSKYRGTDGAHLGVFPVGDAPYTYSKATGYRQHLTTSPTGTWTGIQDSGVANMPWGKFTWNTEPAGSTPAGTAILVEARAADDQANLSGQVYVAFANGVSNPALHGRYLQIRVTLQASALGVSPVLSNLRVETLTDPPVAYDQGVTTNEDTAKNITLTASDPNGDPLMAYEIVSGPTHGSLSGTGANRTYTPAGNYNGPDSFTFRVSDGQVWSEPATVSISVDAVNDAPVLNFIGNRIVKENQALAFSASASDVEGDALSYELVNAPTGATIGETTGAFNWTPTEAQGPGIYTFTVKVKETTNPTVKDEETIHVLVEEAPLGVVRAWGDNGGGQTTVPPGLRDMVAVGAGDYHSLALKANGTVVAWGYNGFGQTTVPPEATNVVAVAAGGYHSLALKADGTVVAWGLNSNGQATVPAGLEGVQAIAGGGYHTLVIRANMAPVANPQSVSAVEDTPLPITLTGSDADGDPLTSYAVVTGPAHGTLTGSGASRTYTPAGNYNGSDSFTFRVYDGYVWSEPATVSIDITNVYDPIVTASANRLLAHAPTLVINGSDFDPIAANNVVTFNSGSGTVTAATSNQLTVTFSTPPALGQLTAVVTIDGSSSGVPMQVATVVPSLVVDNALDEDDGNTSPGDLSLREAIRMANDTPGNDTIGFAVTGTIDLLSVLPNLASNIAIQGPGATQLTIRRQSASNFGIFTVTAGATVEVSGLTLTGGKSLSAGGGIHNYGTLTVQDSVIVGNTALNGGGLNNNNNATMTVVNSTIADNHATGTGPYVGLGGGIHNDGGATLVVKNSTLSGNTAVAQGGAILTNGSSVTVQNSTIANNRATKAGSQGGGILRGAGVVNVKNSLIAGNTATSGADFQGAATSGGYNLIGTTSGSTGFSAASHDLLNVNAMLGPLEDNGGPTRTHALLPGSPGFNAGDPNFTPPPATDQRGLERVLSGRIDIGAYEVQNQILSVQTTSTALAYMEGNGAVVIDSGLKIIDPDSTDIAGARVSLSTNYRGDQDTLEFSNQLGITGTFDPSTGVLTLSGTASMTAYQTALRSVAYRNSSEDPDVATRTVTFEVTDVYGLKASATRNLTVAGVNDPPVLTKEATTVGAPEGGILRNAGTYSDVDAGDSVQLTASVGTVTRTGTNGGTWSWSMPAEEGPAGPTLVTITADDRNGGVTQTSFTYTIDNVAPTLSPAQLANPLANISSTDVVRGNIWNSFFSDPVTGKVYWMPGYGESGTGAQAIEFPDLASFQSNVNSRTITLPVAYEGTYHAALDGYLYYAQYNSNTLVKVRANDGALVASATLPDAGFHNRSCWNWGGYSDINFYVDTGNLLYVMWANPAAGNTIQVSRLNPDTLAVEQTWAIPRVKTETGFAFIANGVVYLGYSYHWGFLTHRFDLLTGVLDPAGYYNELKAPEGGNRPYVSNLYWDPATNRLFEVDNDHHIVYSNALVRVNSLSAPAEVGEAGVVTLTGTVQDPGLLDPHTLTIDWDDPNHTADSTFAVDSTSTLAVDQSFTSPDGAVLTITAVEPGTGRFGFSVQHSYADNSADPRNIVVRVSDDDGGTDSASTAVRVHNVAPTVSAVTLTSPISEGDTATLTGRYVDPGTLDSHTVEVEWADGSPVSRFSLGRFSTLLVNQTYNSSTDSAVLTVTALDPVTHAVDFRVEHVYPDDLYWSAPSLAEVTQALESDPTLAGDPDFARLVEQLTRDYLPLLSTPDYYYDGTSWPKIFGVNEGSNSGGFWTYTGYSAYQVAATPAQIAEMYYLERTDPAAFRAAGFSYPSRVYLTPEVTQSGYAIFEHRNYYYAPEWILDYRARSEFITLPNNLGYVVATRWIEEIENIKAMWELKVITSVGVDASGNPISRVYTIRNETFDTMGLWSSAVERRQFILGNEQETDHHNAGLTTPFGPRVTVTDKDEGRDYSAAPIVVNNVAPTVNAGTDQTVQEGATVTFAGLFIDPGLVDTHIILWDFGDGTTASGTLTPTHAYKDNGIYTVRLTVTDDDGGVGSDTLTVTVENATPWLEVLAPSPIDENLAAHLTGTIIDPGSGDSFTLTVDWGEGGPQTYDLPAGTTTFDVTHQYLDDNPTGTPFDFYRLSVSVTDDDGATGHPIPTVVESIVNGGFETGDLTGWTPVLDWTVGVAGGGVFGTTQPLSGQYDAHNNFESFSWATRQLYQDVVIPEGMSILSTNHRIVYNSDWYTSSTPRTFGISLRDTSNQVLRTLHSTEVYLDGSGATYDLGWTTVETDVSAFAGQTVRVVFEQNAFPSWYGGRFNLELDVISLTTTVPLQVRVNNVAPLVEAGLDQAGTEGTTVGFSGSFSDVGTQDTHTFLWDFGDGTTATGTLTPTHVYADNGTYTVRLTVTDDDGGVGTDTLTVTVENADPTLDPISNQAASEGETVNLLATFHDPGTLDTHTATIDWGDGSAPESGTVTESPFGPPGSTEGQTGMISGSHVYTDEGTYTATVTVKDDEGGLTSRSFTVTVHNVAPTLLISGDASVNEGATYTLNLSSHDPGNDTIDHWTIDWGDGSVQTVSGNPSRVTHVYAEGPRTHRITATATDEDGTWQATIAGGSAYAALDPTFGTGGEVRLDDPDSLSTWGPLLTTQPDGKIVQAGTRLVPISPTQNRVELVLARYLSNGTPDPTFGTAGLVMDPSFGTPVALAVDGAGRIVVVGYYATLARYNPDGTPDNTFGRGADHRVNLAGQFEQIRALAVDAAGNLVVGGLRGSPGQVWTTQYDMVVARLHSEANPGAGIVAGDLDTSFSGDGVAQLDLGTLTVESSEYLYDLTLDSAGRIIGVGNVIGAYRPNGDATAWSGQFAVARWLPDGTLDASFGVGGVEGVDGIVLTPFTELGQATSVATDGLGRILVGGTFGKFGQLGNLARYLPTGVLDTSFDTDGVVSLGTSFKQMAIDAANRVVVAVPASGYTTHLRRYQENGTLDMSFAPGGNLTINGRWISDMTLDGEGRILIGGDVGPPGQADLYVARYTTGGLAVNVLNVAPTPRIVSPMPGGDRYVLTTDYYGNSYFTPIEGGSFGATEVIDSLWRSGCYGAGIGDFDGDGDLDALVGDGYGGHTWFYEKLDPGNDFAPAVSIDDTGHVYRMDFAEADFDGDGHLDAVMADHNANYFTIYLGNGDGTFARSTMPSPWWIIGMDAADFNNDGKMDFAASSWGDNATRIYLGNGDGTFTPGTQVDTGFSWGVSAGDFNEDGTADLIVGSDLPGFYPGNADGTFGMGKVLGFQNNVHALAETDVDGDGHLDLLFTGYDWWGGNNGLWAAAGNGDGTFQTPVLVSRHGDSRLYGIAASPLSSSATYSEGDLVPFVGQGTDPGLLDPLTFTWNWGDSTSDPPVTVPGDSTLVRTVNAAHSYRDEGTYTARLTVADDDGGSGTDDATIIVKNVAPWLTDLTATDTVENGVSVLSGVIHDPGVEDSFILTIDWGDGKTENRPFAAGTHAFDVAHQYLDNPPSGEYTIRLIISDNDGGFTTAETSVKVANVAPVIAPNSSRTVQAGETLVIGTWSFTDPGSLDTHTAVVNWGDGTIEGFPVSGRQVQVGGHTYQTPGTYRVTLTVFDDDGASHSEAITVNVNQTPSSAAFLAGVFGLNGAVPVLEAPAANPTRLVAPLAGMPTLAPAPSVSMAWLGNGGQPQVAEAVETASLYGVVALDTDASGAMDDTEHGLPGVMVTVIGPVMRTTITNEEGLYFFDDLPPGEYTILRGSVEEALALVGPRPPRQRTPDNPIAQAGVQLPASGEEGSGMRIRLEPGARVPCHFVVPPVVPAGPAVPPPGREVPIPQNSLSPTVELNQLPEEVRDPASPLVVTMTDSPAGMDAGSVDNFFLAWTISAGLASASLAWPSIRRRTRRSPRKTLLSRGKQSPSASRVRR